MFKHLAITLLCFLSFRPVGSAAEKPDFSGVWKLDLTKSDLGPMPAPGSMTLKIEHKDPDLKVRTTITGGPQGDLKNEAKYTTDGKESVNRLAGHDAHSTASWDGGSLVLLTKADFGAGNVEIRSRWELLDGGKVLKQSAHVTSAQGSFDPTYLFNRETMR